MVQGAPPPRQIALLGSAASGHSFAEVSSSEDPAWEES